MGKMGAKDLLAMIAIAVSFSSLLTQI